MSPREAVIIIMRVDCDSRVLSLYTLGAELPTQYFICNIQIGRDEFEITYVSVLKGSSRISPRKVLYRYIRSHPDLTLRNAQNGHLIYILPDHNYMGFQ